MAGNARLAELFGPPETEPGFIDWHMIESRTGLLMPSDYIEWANTYTSLYVDGFLRILHPVNFFSVATREEIAEELMGISEMDPPLRQETYDAHGDPIGEALPIYPCFPESGGLLPWGNTDNGDILMWLTEGSPNEWRIIVVDGDSYTWQEFDCGFSDFLIGLLESTLPQVNLPGDLRPAIKEFQGYGTSSSGRKIPIWRSTSRWDQYFEQQRAEIDLRNRPPR
jgi:hypothetical protein